MDNLEENINILDLFLMRKFINEVDLNYEDLELSNIQDYQKGMDIFLSLINRFFYDDDVLVYRINSVFAFIKLDFLVFIKNLYEQSKYHSKNIELFFISEFLFTYYQSIKSTRCKSETKDYSDKLTEFSSVFNEVCFRPDGEIFINSINFYSSLLKHIQSNKVFLHEEVLRRILNNSRQLRNIETIVDNLLLLECRLDVIYEYDTKVNDHLSYYHNFIKISFDKIFLKEISIELLKKLKNRGLSSSEVEEVLINKYVDIVNNIVESINKNSDNFIEILVEIKDAIEVASKIKEAIYVEESKKKIKECLTVLLFYKRVYLSDQENIKKSLKSFDFKLSKPKFGMSIKEYLIKSPMYLYSLAKINFNKSAEESIKIYSEYPMQFLSNRLEINNNQTYTIQNTGYRNNILEYYLQFLKKYVSENSSDLRNLPHDNELSIYLYYLDTIDNLSLNYIALELEYDDNWIKSYCLNNLKIENKIYENTYVFLVKVLIILEYHLNKVYEKLFSTKPSNIEDILNKLFEYYSENDEYINGIMYIYYMIYFSSGRNLRNKIMHGELIGRSNYSQEIICIFSSIVFMHYLIYKEDLYEK